MVNVTTQEMDTHPSKHSSKNSRTRTAIFTDLWKKGFYITEGEKFGADFLAYPGDPLK